MSLLLDSVLEGGPGDGAEIAVPEGMDYLLVTQGPRVFGYLRVAATNAQGRWIFREECQVGSFFNQAGAASVLRSAGRPCVELRAKQAPVSHLLFIQSPPPADGAAS